MSRPDRQEAVAAPAAALADDLLEAALLVARLRREAALALAEASARRVRARAHGGTPLDPRSQGLRHAAEFHEARARAATSRLADAEAYERRLVQVAGWRPCG